ncbi:hypothetical protein [Haliscomenobacter sp.]|uniref:hypothetical protein n=1 Tax=Haliscomenobacter sp. TaxID=2717303 RepID=UPI0033650363
MTFFYNLNDKLNAIREKPETTHGQLNERDMGKHNNKTTGFDALAKKAGKEYGSKAAGERVAGAQFQKMKKSGKLEEEGMSRAAKGYEKYGKEGMEALAKAGRDGKALDPVRAKYDKYDDKPVDEGMGDVAKRVGSAVKKAGGAVLNKLGHGSDKDMRKDLQRKMGMTPTGDKPDGALKYAAKTFVKHAKDPLGLKNEAGLPMTTVNGKKVPKFAADGRGANDLAKKKTFADKIAGAKQEVEEMLGDVAAEAIKSALSPKQKKIDMNKNGKLDANDFAMLRKGGNKQVADEGFDDMEKDVKSRMSARRVGDVTHGDKHDTQEIPGGRRVTRRVDPNTGYSVGADSDASADGEKRGRGRPKGADKGPERVTGRATKHKGGRKTNENDLDITDRGEYDQEGDMAKDSIKTVVRHAQALEKILGDNDNLPEWVQSKLAKIEGMMTAVDDYMQNQEDEEMAMGEEKTSTRDNRAERAGRKVAKDIEYDEKKKDGIHGKKRGSEDDRAEKAGKKVAKDIEHDEKKKKVKEQGGTDTPTASSGFGFGQGIYDSMNRELESMISEAVDEENKKPCPPMSHVKKMCKDGKSSAEICKMHPDCDQAELKKMVADCKKKLSESMNISMSMNTDANGGPSQSVTVTATDDDAMKLGVLLKNAGLGGDHAMGGQVPGAEIEVHGAEGIADQIRQAVDGDHGHDDEVCDACGQQECGCETVDEAYGDDVVSQNSPDYPTNTETAQDNFEYSGGLNGPKSTGQSTVPVLASQEDRQHTYEDDQELRRMMEMAGVKKKEVDEEKTEEGNLFTKGLADDDIKVGEKIPGTNAVKKKDIDEGILASTASLWKQYKGQYGV